MFPLTVMAKAGAALLVPTLIGQPAGPQCQLDRLTYVSADERAIGRFTAATHDYVAAGRTATLFTDATAEIFRFRLRVTRWLHR